MICDPKDVSSEVRDFFTLRGAHWPFEMKNTPYAWHWEATYPQPYGFTDDPEKPEQMNVSVAQNLNIHDGPVSVAMMSSPDSRGRSFSQGRIDTSPGAIDRGLNFQEQWERALEVDPPFVMVTGWNEWIAGKFHTDEGGVYFVDQFDAEHSRDIEPAKSSHGDNYYYQLVANVRRYKGATPLPPPVPMRTMAIDGDFVKWRQVEPEFLATGGRLIPRNYPGWGSLGVYKTEAARNAVVAAKICCDSKNVFFYVRTRDALSPSTDPNWMILLIDSDGRCDLTADWLGYDQVIRPGVTKNISFHYAGNELELALPRSLVENCFDFKWIDGIAPGGDPLDLILTGNAVPAGRFNFRAQLEH